MFFLSLSNADVQFAETEKLTWRNHSAATALFTRKNVKFIDKKKFVAAVLDKKDKIFVIYLAALLAIIIYPNKETYIRALIANKFPTKVPMEYFNYADVFWPDQGIELPEHFRIYNHAINIVKDK